MNTNAEATSIKATFEEDPFGDMSVFPNVGGFQLGRGSSHFASTMLTGVDGFLWILCC